MNAQLKPVAMPIVAPTYDNTLVRFVGSWVNANIGKLRAYYAELGKTLPEDSDDGLLEHSRAQNFVSFCHVQYDLARERSLS